jgi:hypothetical protein
MNTLGLIVLVVTLLVIFGVLIGCTISELLLIRGRDGKQQFSASSMCNGKRLMSNGKRLRLQRKRLHNEQVSRASPSGADSARRCGTCGLRRVIFVTSGVGDE